MPAPPPAPGPPLERGAALVSAPTTLSFTRAAAADELRDPSLARIGSKLLLGWVELHEVGATTQLRFRLRMMDAAGIPAATDAITLYQAGNTPAMSPVVVAFADRFLVVWGEGALVRGLRIGLDGVAQDAAPFDIMRDCASGYLAATVVADTALIGCSLTAARVRVDGTVLDATPLEPPRIQYPIRGTVEDIQGEVTDVVAGQDGFLMLIGIGPNPVIPSIRWAATVSLAGAVGPARIFRQTAPADEFTYVSSPRGIAQGAGYYVVWAGTPDGIQTLAAYAPLAEDLFGIALGADGVAIDTAPRLIFSHVQQQINHVMVKTAGGFFVAFQDRRICPGPYPTDCGDAYLPWPEALWGASFRSDGSLLDTDGVRVAAHGTLPFAALATDVNGDVLVVNTQVVVQNYPSPTDLVLTRVARGAAVIGAVCATGSECASGSCAGGLCCQAGCSDGVGADAGAPVDSAARLDAGALDATAPVSDARAANDADAAPATPADAHVSDAASDVRADAATAPDSAGCGCRTAARFDSDLGGALGGCALLGLALLRRRAPRRRGRSR